MTEDPASNAKQPLIMFGCSLLALYLVIYVSGKSSFFNYVMAFFGACAITLRWSDFSFAPRWLYWILLAPVLALLTAFACMMFVQAISA